MSTSPRAPMRRGIAFATEALEPLLPLARDAERAGFDRVWTTEFIGRDAIARALAIAMETDLIDVGTGIAYAFTRQPLAMAAQAADVQRLSGGRFALGLGTGTRGVRRYYDAEFEPPARRFSAYVDDLHRAWAGFGGMAQGDCPPIFGAGLNPTMVRTAARTCDGVLLHPLALVRRHLLARVMPALRRGMLERGAEGSVVVWCVTSISADGQEAREHARRQLAFYLSTPSYASVVAATEWSDVAREIRYAFDASGRRASWTELGELVPETLIDEIALAGTAEDVREAVLRLESELAVLGVDELVFQTVGAGMSEEDVVLNCAQIITTLARTSPTMAGADHA